MMVCPKRIFLLTCFIISSTSSSGEQEIKVKSGDDVILQCQRPNVVIKLIQWSKPDLKSDKYVYYYRDEKQFENYQHEFYRGRVELKDPKMKDGDVSVILKNININDAGTYECYVGNGDGVLRLINIINLRVEPGTVKGGGDKDGGHIVLISMLVFVVVVL